MNDGSRNTHTAGTPVNDVALDDVLMVITLRGMLLAGAHIRAGFRDSRRH
jgi:hypothetical protein